jgi:hypothetical protein
MTTITSPSAADDNASSAPKMLSAESLDPIILAHELDCAWKLMEHHQRKAEGAVRDLAWMRDELNRLKPQAAVYYSICNLVNRHTGDADFIRLVKEYVQRGDVALAKVLAEQEAREKNK